MRCSEVAAGVFLVRGTDVNWVLLRDGADATLIDGGYPGDLAAVLDSITAIGVQPHRVVAMLLTHAHVDHMGAANHLHQRFGVPVYAHPDEVGHARRDHLQQAGPLDVARRALAPGVLGWSMRIARAGAMRHVRIASALPFPDAGAALDLPGRPLPVPTPGHTSGHCAYHVAAAGAVVTGDALVTGHPTSSLAGPQMLASWFNHDSPTALASLDNLEGLQADLLLPGHGEQWRGPISEAVSVARERAAT